jgi:hypothetical protein
VRRAVPNQGRGESPYSAGSLMCSRKRCAG